MLDGLFESRELGITLLGCRVAAHRVVTGSGVKMGFGEKLCKAICTGVHRRHGFHGRAGDL